LGVLLFFAGWFFPVAVLLSVLVGLVELLLEPAAPGVAAVTGGVVAESAGAICGVCAGNAGAVGMGIVGGTTRVGFGESAVLAFQVSGVGSKARLAHSKGSPPATIATMISGRAAVRVFSVPVAAEPPFMFPPTPAAFSVPSVASLVLGKS
jgi:hypothetical protein